MMAEFKKWLNKSSSFYGTCFLNSFRIFSREILALPSLITKGFENEICGDGNENLSQKKSSNSSCEAHTS